ncbi:biotin-dependent carboxyltransferase family protein [Methylocella sp.]|uniref:biotin-dependent carboxyltransferase family protein n=1 Tax=Methylocella sp. TaxID=1978226 RepID=UPI0037835735
MSATGLRIVAAGPGATVQDQGRFGFMRFGVTPAGPMDPQAFAAAAALAGNDGEAAAVEIGPGGISVTSEGAPLALAFAGGGFSWRRAGEPLPPAARLMLGPGEVLSARPGGRGVFAYLSVAGGFLTPPELGSRATHTRSGMGGLEGRMLRAGDVLPVGARAVTEVGEACPDDSFDLAPHDAPLRVILGPQDDYFGPDAIAAFLSGAYALTPRADRMAYALSGPPVTHARGFDIVSDGLAMGAVQIAGDRQPLVLMADRQPTGGYPKIAHVISADLGRLAQTRPGESVRFMATTLDDALAARRALDQRTGAAARRLRPLARAATTRRLLAVNLVSGVTDGRP